MLRQTRDSYGCPVLIVRNHDLNDFRTLLPQIRKKCCEQGFAKLRIHEEDINKDCLNKLLSAMDKAFRGECYDSMMKCNVPTYSPDVQIYFKAAIEEDVFEYVKSDCAKEERDHFVSTFGQAETYESKDNCCSQVLAASGLGGLKKHLFDMIRSSSQYNPYLQEVAGKQKLAAQHLASPPISGVHIPLDHGPYEEICDGFSLSRLRTILDEFSETYGSITSPCAYAGSLHNAFAWHVVDMGLFSFNYLVKGAKKLWFFIAPKYFGTADLYVSGLRIDRSQASCRALLVSHKVLVADPDFFKRRGIPYSMVTQEPGEIIVTLPFALHSGFDLGSNLSLAANFADEDCIQEGLYTPSCNCFTDIKLDLTSVLRKYKPNLLKMYKEGTALIFPHGHPREILKWQPFTTVLQDETERHKHQKLITTNVKEASHLQKLSTQSKKRLLCCPACNSTFQDNKMQRLKNHIERRHSEEQDNLLRLVNVMYPPWKPKTTEGSTCNVCSKFIRGSKTHLRLHINKVHPNMYFPS